MEWYVYDLLAYLDQEPPSLKTCTMLLAILSSKIEKNILLRMMLTPFGCFIIVPFVTKCSVLVKDEIISWSVDQAIIVNHKTLKTGHI